MTNWITYQQYTPLTAGEWLATILHADGTREVAVLRWDGKRWSRTARRGAALRALHTDEVVIGISTVPEPMPIANAEFIEAWYDRRLRLWYAARRDGEGNMVGSAGVGPTRRDAIADTLYVASLTQRCEWTSSE